MPSLPFIGAFVGQPSAWAAWSRRLATALSSDAVSPGSQPPNNAPASSNTNSSTPDGVRLILNLPPSPAGAGELTLDWVRPNFSNTKS